MASVSLDVLVFLTVTVAGCTLLQASPAAGPHPSPRRHNAWNPSKGRDALRRIPEPFPNLSQKPQATERAGPQGVVESGQPLNGTVPIRPQKSESVIAQQNAESHHPQSLDNHSRNSKAVQLPVPRRVVEHPSIFGDMRIHHPEIFSAAQSTDGVVSRRSLQTRRRGLNALSITPNVQADVCLLSASVCPPFPQCGAYVTCPSPPRVIVCQGCARGYCTQGTSYCDAPDGLVPTRVCDFKHARCTHNNNTNVGISGAFCQPRSKNNQCGLEHSCRRDWTTQSAVYRCCRTSCPANAFGSPAFRYVNNCGWSIRCPTTTKA